MFQNINSSHIKYKYVIQNKHKHFLEKFGASKQFFFKEKYCKNSVVKFYNSK